MRHVPKTSEMFTVKNVVVVVFEEQRRLNIASILVDSTACAAGPCLVVDADADKLRGQIAPADGRLLF